MATNKHPYLIEVFWSDEDEAYIANVPDLPGCSAGGTTEVEAIDAAHVAIDLPTCVWRKCGGRSRDAQINLTGHVVS
jgi:HicB_like antitoxin of bacterial toxin-antitoxin system